MLRTPEKTMTGKQRLFVRLLILCNVSGASAQQAATSLPFTLEIETRERWMNARQMSIHTPSLRTSNRITFDSVVMAGAIRTWWGRVGERAQSAIALTM